MGTVRACRWTLPSWASPAVVDVRCGLVNGTEQIIALVLGCTVGGLVISSKVFREKVDRWAESMRDRGSKQEGA